MRVFPTPQHPPARTSAPCRDEDFALSPISRGADPAVRQSPLAGPERSGHPLQVFASKGPESWRPLSLMSKIFLWLSTLVNPNSLEFIELDGALCHTTLRRAASQVQRQRPMLRCRLVRRGLRYGWCEISDAGNIELVVYPHDGDRASARAFLMNTAWQTPLDLAQGPPIRLLLAEAKTFSTLLIVTSHLCEDARAGYRLIHDLASAYSALSAGMPACQDTPIDHTLLGDEPFRHLRTNSVRVWAQAVRLILRDLVFRPRRLWPTAKPRGRAVLARLDVEPHVFLSLRAGARHMGVTLHTLFMAALIRTVEQYEGAYRPYHTFLDMYSLSTRAKRDVAHVYENMVIPYTLFIPNAHSDTDLLRRIAEILARLHSRGVIEEVQRLRLYDAVISLLPMKWATHFLVTRIATASMVVTNPGPIPFASESFGSTGITDCYSFAQLYPPARMMWQFSTFRDTLRVLLIYDPAAVKEDVPTVYLKPFMENLTRIADVASGVTRQTIGSPRSLRNTFP